MTAPNLGALAARRASLQARLAPNVWRVVRPAEQQQTPELDADGKVVPAEAPVVHEGPGMVSDPSSGSALRGAVTVNDESGVPNQRILKLGNDADLRPGDIATCVSARWSPGLVGDNFVVMGEEERSVALYRRYVVRGSSWLPS
jgi:hypothetical protein